MFADISFNDKSIRKLHECKVKKNRKKLSQESLFGISKICLTKTRSGGILFLI